MAIDNYKILGVINFSLLQRHPYSLQQNALASTASLCIAFDGWQKREEWMKVFLV